MGSARPPGVQGATSEPALQDDGTLVLANSGAPKPSGVHPASSGTKPAAGGSGGAGCPCSGMERTSLAGLDKVKSYSGDLPSPLQVMWYVPAQGEGLRLEVPDKEIRRWVKEAAEYHGVPHMLLAVILQQENAPGATMFRKFGQFAERSTQTFAAIMDEWFWDVVPDKYANASSGFANMKRSTLRRAAAYSETMYGRPPMPDDVRYRILGWDQDTRIPGDDWRADLYYCAAHLRELIDRATGRTCHSGALSREQLERVIKSYNGSGPKAEKYAKDAIALLADANAGKATLYFYEK
ncbi:MAG: hypothetical protein AB7G11_06695 [Phycisphaerales bacterium]